MHDDPSSVTPDPLPLQDALPVPVPLPAQIPSPLHAPVPVLLVCGVSGSGKTTIGTLLARRLGWVYAEADAFHPAANVAKMAAGHPLDDADRAPWLAAIGAFADETTRAGRPAVITCSALKRAYRDVLRKDRPNLRLVFLEAPYEVIRERLAGREGHFFPPELLASQFADLEAPGPDEPILRVAVGDEAPERIVERLLRLGVAELPEAPAPVG